MYQNNDWNNRCQKHVHEIIGIAEPVTECRECHTHRFCTVSGEAKKISEYDHFHEVTFRTDFADGHYHEFCGKTGGAIDVGNGKHIHYLKDFTQEEDGHKHRFQAATLIESPTDFECKKGTLLA